MKSDEAKKKRSEEIAEFAEKLYGRVQDMGPEEIDELYSEIAPNEHPAERIYEIAEKCARRYRLENQTPPSHVEAVLKAAKPVTNLEGTNRERLAEIIQNALRPHSSRPRNVSFAFQRKGEVTKEDQEILKELSEELREKDKD